MMTLERYSPVCDASVANDEVTIKVESQIVNGKKVMKKIFICQCGKSFNQRYLWQRHNVRHTGSRNFTCDICKKSFGLSSTLNRHKVVHADESQRKHKCPTCGRAFHLLGVLKDHIKTHTRDVTFDCAHCGKKFLKKTNLGHHLDVMHTEKTFSCETCSQKFPTESILKSHTMQWHKIQPISCENCNLQMNSKWELSLHVEHCEVLRPVTRKPHCNTIHLSNGLKTIKIRNTSLKKVRRDKDKAEEITDNDTIKLAPNEKAPNPLQNTLKSSQADSTYPQSDSRLSLDQNYIVQEPCGKLSNKAKPSQLTKSDNTSPSATSSKTSLSAPSYKGKTSSSSSTTSEDYSTLVSILNSQSNKTQDGIINVCQTETQKMNLSVGGIRYVPIIPANSDVTKMDAAGGVQGVQLKTNMLAVPAGIKPGSLVIVPSAQPLTPTKNVSAKLKPTQNMSSTLDKKRKLTTNIDKKQNVKTKPFMKHKSKSKSASNVLHSNRTVPPPSPYEVENPKGTHKKIVTKPSSLNLTNTTWPKPITTSGESPKEPKVITHKDGTTGIGMCLPKESPETPQPYLSQYLSNSDISNFNLEEVCIMSSEPVSTPEGGVEIVASNDLSNPEEQLVVPIDDVSSVVIIPMSSDDVYEGDISINAEISSPTEVLVSNDEQINDITTSEHVDIPTGDTPNNVQDPDVDSLQRSPDPSQVIFNVAKDHTEIESITTPDLLSGPSLLTCTQSNNAETANVEPSPSSTLSKIEAHKSQQKSSKEKLSIQPVKLNEYFNYMLTQIDPESNKSPCEDGAPSPSTARTGDIQGQMFDPLENPQETNTKK